MVWNKIQIKIALEKAYSWSQRGNDTVYSTDGPLQLFCQIHWLIVAKCFWHSLGYLKNHITGGTAKFEAHADIDIIVLHEIK